VCARAGADGGTLLRGQFVLLLNAKKDEIRRLKDRLNEDDDDEEDDQV
jgi:hypothetical protein